ncbi:MAG TPA: N-acetylmuramic acid 6-phosphate etherase [Myxococcales bacterium]|nr:N-acetylmuramic acid 6-phosphate etherase [Myxococcales bacterium]HIL00663.1 N-acetylmuramic acid 6-phosphate etherase [Myxococcales bacterium]
MASNPEKLPTEAVLEAARDLDRRSTGEVLSLIHEQDAFAHAAVGRCLSQMEEAVEVLATAIAGGGHWFNVGAGTSGRLGVLDASEIPPTYGMNPRVVQAVIAGGDRALRHPVEGAEDDSAAAAFELQERGLAPGDVVLGISASGRTPYVIGAMEAAREVGARRIVITCDANSLLAQCGEISIVPQVGAEVVAGSTRMKGGLAQKMILAALSTAVMVKLGKVRGNFMTHVTPVSNKLRGRAVRIVMEITGVDRARARDLLRENEGSVERALEAAGR